ncbi:MAG TPA: CHAT domain-containing protein, partial [Nitrospiraceae bacterium]|nr:CHAT domain-containing protein [Nitrospiraceae bacterium]
NPRTAGALGLLAQIHRLLQQPQRALTLLQQAQDIQLRNAGKLLLVGSEARKLRYLRLLQQSAYADVSFSVSSPGPDSAMLGLTRVLNHKGRALDVMSNSVLRLRNAAELADQELFLELSRIASQLSNLTYRQARDLPPDNYRNQLEQLSQRQQEIESRLARRSSEFGQQLIATSPAQIATAIPADAALIEWFRYIPTDANTSESKPRYVAYVLKHRGTPLTIDMGDAQSLDARIGACRATFSDPARGDVKQCAMALYVKLFKPLQPHLQSVRHLLMAPDGALNLVPMAALADERGQYLVQRFEVSYLSSGRELLRPTRPAAGGADVVIASPDYGP